MALHQRRHPLRNQVLMPAQALHWRRSRKPPDSLPRRGAPKDTHRFKRALKAEGQQVLKEREEKQAACTAWLAAAEAAATAAQAKKVEALREEGQRVLNQRAETQAACAEMLVAAKAAAAASTAAPPPGFEWGAIF